MGTKTKSDVSMKCHRWCKEVENRRVKDVEITSNTKSDVIICRVISVVRTSKIEVITKLQSSLI